MAVRRIITDPETIRSKILTNVEQAIQGKFPIEAGNYKAVLKNITIKRAEMPHAAQRDVLMVKGNASEAVYVDLDIEDKTTGKVIYTLKNHRLMNIPYFTNRYTLIVSGNEYNIVNQMRTKSGVYTRRRGNDELESSFNLAKGSNFRLSMSPETGLFKINMLGATLPMFAVVKILGAPENEIHQVLGKELFAINSNVSENQMERTRSTLFKKLVKGSNLGDTATSTEMEQGIRQYFAGTKLDPETTKITLGKSLSKVDYTAILEASKKILKVFNNREDVDERDNLEFQQVFSVEDILKEVIDKNNDAVSKITGKLKSFVPTGDKTEDEKKLKAIFSSVYFTKPVRNFITTSSISRLPSQINPYEIINSAATVTRLGEGAISSEQAVPEETRAVNYSYIGIIDPVATPESSKVGIDNHVTISAMKGDDNEFYREVINCKSGKPETKRVIELHDSIVGFPDPTSLKEKDKKPSDIVAAVKAGKLIKVKRAELDFQTPTPHDLNTVTSATLPFINANQANRLVMGAKHVQQAMPLKDPEGRLVRASLASARGESTAKRIGDFLNPKSPVDGTVSKIDDHYIHIKGKDGTTHKVDYENNLPLATKTFLHNDLKIKKGDTVSRGQVLSGSNFSKDGELAVGKTLKVAYMPYQGLNHEDGIVISKETAQKMTSVHSEKITVRLDKLKVLDRSKYLSMFPTNYTKKQISKLDSDGVVKEGQTLDYGDPLILVMEDTQDSKVNQILGALHRSLKNPYRDCSEVYDHHEKAEVLKVAKTKSLVTVMLKVEKAMKEGDKLAGSYGNKGVVTKILESPEMPHDEAGEPIDVIFTPVGVPARINPAQILESSLGKVVKKTGKKYDIENFSQDDYVSFVKSELKKHGIKDKETVTDPTTGKKVPGIFVGQQYMHKLFKTSDTNYAARGIDGAHDQDDTPTGSGETGPKALGGMEVNALIAHNVRGFLKDSSVVRSSKNTEFWNAFKYGHVTHMPTEKKTFNKFLNILNQAGVKIEKKGSEFVAGPLTDKDILKMSAGEIKDGKRLNAKDLSPETGGLFDEKITGGLQGDRWSHIKLQEPVINPVFKDAARHVLGMSNKELNAFYLDNGGKKLRKKLNEINPAKELPHVEKELNDPKLKGIALDNTVKKYKYLKALDKQGTKPGDAYTLSVVPITPPNMRPITVGKTGDTMENDANYLYRDLILQNNSYKELIKEGLDDEDTLKENRKALLDRVTELAGYAAPTSAQLAGKGVKGAAAFIAGDTPKRGFFQNKVVYSKMNTSGRATIIPDNTLGLDDVGLPEEAAWEMYQPFVIRKMVQMGYSSYQAKEQVEQRTDAAKSVLLEELENRPVVVNRAPTLWRHSILTAKPKLRSGKNLHVNTLWENATNQDYDGDAMQIHVPASDTAIKDAWNMLPSKQLFSDKKRGDLLMAPTHEPIVGLYKATANLGEKRQAKNKVQKFKTEAEAWKAYHAGTLKMTDLVEIG